MSSDGRTPHPIESDPFAGFVGAWSGTARTWFDPTVLADESPVQGRIERVLNGRFLRHTYEGAMQGRPRHGEETIAVDRATGLVQVSWMDDFHMSACLMWSEGPLTAQGCSVTGKYEVGPGERPWRWRTEYLLEDADHLVIRAFNVTPDGEESRAVETRYARVGPS